MSESHLDQRDADIALGEQVPVHSEHHDDGTDFDIIAMALDAADEEVDLPPDLERRIFEAADAVRSIKSTMASAKATTVNFERQAEELVCQMLSSSAAAHTSSIPAIFVSHGTEASSNEKLIEITYSIIGALSEVWIASAQNKFVSRCEHYSSAKSALAATIKFASHVRNTTFAMRWHNIEHATHLHNEIAALLSDDIKTSLRGSFGALRNTERDPYTSRQMLLALHYADQFAAALLDEEVDIEDVLDRPLALLESAAIDALQNHQNAHQMRHNDHNFAKLRAENKETHFRRSIFPFKSIWIGMLGEHQPTLPPMWSPIEDTEIFPVRTCTTSNSEDIERAPWSMPLPD